MMTVDLSHLTEEQRQDVLKVIDDMLRASRRLNAEAVRMQDEFLSLTAALETFKRNVEAWPVGAYLDRARRRARRTATGWPLRLVNGEDGSGGGSLA